MNNAVFDPAILFIEVDRWKDTTTRDRFLQHLLENLNALDEYAKCSIFWSDQLELCLWAKPPFPPWRMDRDWSNPLVPILYTKFHSKYQMVLCENTNQATAEPALDFIRDDVAVAFLTLMNELAMNEEPVYICLSLEEGRKGHTSYKFWGMPDSRLIIAPPVRIPSDWLRYIDIVEDYWPQKREEGLQFMRAISLTLQRNYPTATVLYKYSCSEAFIKDIINENTYREQILDRIAKRLVLDPASARADGQLQDEKVAGANQNRFRVTPRPSSTRIHYAYDGTGQITFLRFYGAGEHDDGL